MYKLIRECYGGYYAESEYYNIYSFGETREKALEEANEMFDYFLNHYTSTPDSELTDKALILKRRYINYYETHIDHEK